MKTFYIITCLLILALNQQVLYAQQPQIKEESAEDFVKLEMPLEEALTKITFIVTWLSGEGSDEVIFEGEGVIRTPDYIELRIPYEDDSGRYSYYRILPKYAVEGNRYIFVPLVEGGGGSGAFWNLHVVDKKTLRTIDYIGLGDRSRIKEIILADASTNTISITYIEREVKGIEDDYKVVYDPKKAITKHFRMMEGIAREVEDPFPNMVFIPAGEFQMGSNDSEAHDDEKPVHTVYVNAFYMDKYEVTVGEYKEFLHATGHPAPDWNEIAEDSPTDHHPIVRVSWHDAMAYAKWVDKRLPTEAEWEKAARGGLAGQKYAWGNAVDASKGNYNRNAGGTTVVGSYPANGYGLYDMAGNAWEWCLDAYDSNFYASSPRENPVSGGTVEGIVSNFAVVKTDRVLRGIAWTDTAEPVLVATRVGGNPAKTSRLYGFRCVKAVVP